MKTLLLLALILVSGCSHPKPIKQPTPFTYTGSYLGMTAKNDGNNRVYMYSIRSGECLKIISSVDFTNIFILKNRPEYLPWKP